MRRFFRFLRKLHAERFEDQIALVMKPYEYEQLDKIFAEVRTKLRPWELLGYDAGQIWKGVYTAWNQILSNSDSTERDSLRFLQNHCGFFFVDQPDKPFAVSELRLGAEHRIDFVEVAEGYSSGTRYKLIEIESPNAKIFRKDGRTSSKLSIAIDQITEWRRWISSHRSEAQRLFPSYAWDNGGEPYFQYEIVIGRSSETQKESGKISSFWKEQKINISSFDRLTERIVKKKFSTFFMTGLSTQSRDCDLDLMALNKAASPLLKSVPDTQYRKMLREFDFSGHITSKFLRCVSNYCEYNPNTLEEFDQTLSKVDKEGVSQLLEWGLQNHAR